MKATKFNSIRPKSIKTMKIHSDFSHKSWFTTFNLEMHNEKRVFAFAYSGAGAGVYYSWSKYFHDNGIDLIAIQLPGREQRIHEKTITYLPDLVSRIHDAIYPLTDIPFAFFGHSLGGLLAFELARSLEKEKARLPQHLFISGFRSPDTPNPNQELHQLDNKMLLKKIAEYGGTPDIILRNNELMALLLPVVRADFTLLETYQYNAAKPFTCPITLFSGDNDNIVRPAHIKNWGLHTTGAFKHITYPGNHFFIHEHKEKIITEITQGLHSP